MQDHLPECPYRVDHPTLPRNRGLICICDELRACEQRVRMESQAWHYRTGYNSGFAETHDPLCPTFRYPDDHCQCRLIAKVREDERNYRNEVEYKYQLASDEGRTAYSAALDAAEQAVETWISYTFPAHRPGWTGKIIAAIRSLKEKP